MIVTVTYALLTKHKWSKDPRFAFIDSEWFCKNLGSLFFTLYHSIPAFVLGTLIDQSQHRLSKLKSSSLRLFTSIWLACILSITVELFPIFYSITIDLCAHKYKDKDTKMQLHNSTRSALRVVWCLFSLFPSFLSRLVTKESYIWKDSIGCDVFETHSNL